MMGRERCCQKLMRVDVVRDRLSYPLQQGEALFTDTEKNN